MHLEDGPNIIRKAETYGRSSLQLESSLSQPLTVSPQSHNPFPAPNPSLSFFFLERSVGKHLRRTAGNPITLCSGLEIILILGGSCKAPWQTFTAFEAGSALPQSPAGLPLAFELASEAAYAKLVKANQPSLRIVRCPFLEPVSVINRRFNRLPCPLKALSRADVLTASRPSVRTAPAFDTNL